MIGISTTTYDLNGHHLFHRDHNSTVKTIASRVARTATLDGGSVLDSGGFSDGDRTIELVQKKPTTADIDFITYIVKTYTQVVVSCSEGVFLAAPSKTSVSRTGDLLATFLVKEQI